MKPASQCVYCKFSKWDTQNNGRLHPSGSGRCTYFDSYPLNIRIPAAFYWPHTNPPRVVGGWINRKREEHKTACVFRMLK